MYKKTLTLVLSVFLIIGLTACGDKSPTSNKEPEEATGKKIKLSFWTGDRHDTDFIKERIAKFNAENTDNIEVELKVMSENYNQSVDIAFASNQAPDILRVGESNFLAFSKKRYLEPLNDLMDDATTVRFKDVIVDGLNKIDGNIYSLPNFGYTKRLIYNVDLFEKAGIKPPATLEEMVAAAKTITEMGKKDGIYGFAANLKNPQSAFDRSLVAQAEISGYPGKGFDFKSGAYDFSVHKEILEAWRQMMEDGSFLPGSESLDIDPLRAQFAEGKIGMYMSVSAELGVFKDQFPAKIEWAGAPIPSINGESNGAASLGNAGYWLALSQASEHKEEAWKFMQYMYDEAFLQTYHEKGLGISLVPSVLAAAAKPEIDHIEGFLPSKYDALWPVAPDLAVEGTKFYETYLKYIVVGGDLDAIMQDLNDRYNSALDKAKAAGTIDVKANESFDPAQLQGIYSN